ncbi:MAG: hypothetical protein ACTSPQ_20185 [Candidatus Helarchaeota archaeon]
MNTRSAIAANHLIKEGIKIYAGQIISYVIINARAKNPMLRVLPAEFIQKSQKVKYDKNEYIKLLKNMFKYMLSFREYGIIPRSS